MYFYLDRISGGGPERSHNDLGGASLDWRQEVRSIRLTLIYLSYRSVSPRRESRGVYV